MDDLFDHTEDGFKHAKSCVRKLGKCKKVENPQLPCRSLT
jgi:hypothetical protein